MRNPTKTLLLVLVVESREVRVFLEGSEKENQVNLTIQMSAAKQQRPPLF